MCNSESASFDDEVQLLPNYGTTFGLPESLKLRQSIPGKPVDVKPRLEYVSICVGSSAGVEVVCDVAIEPAHEEVTRSVVLAAALLTGGHNINGGFVFRRRRWRSRSFCTSKPGCTSVAPPRWCCRPSAPAKVSSAVVRHLLLPQGALGQARWPTQCPRFWVRPGSVTEQTRARLYSGQSWPLFQSVF